MISSNHVGKAIAVHEEGVAECAHCASPNSLNTERQHEGSRDTNVKLALGHLIRLQVHHYLE